MIEEAGRIGDRLSVQQGREGKTEELGKKKNKVGF